MDFLINNTPLNNIFIITKMLYDQLRYRTLNMSYQWSQDKQLKINLIISYHTV